jgi:hypothetical protein
MEALTGKGDEEVFWNYGSDWYLHQYTRLSKFTKLYMKMDAIFYMQNTFQDSII